MTISNIVFYIGIALLYNLFVHNLASVSYKDLQYEEKFHNIIIMLLLFGGIGIMISLFMHKKYNNTIVSNGLFYGGILLIITAIWGNWENMNEEMKLLLLASIFGYILWYCFKREEKSKIEDGKLNEEIITDLLQENKVES